MTIFMISHRTQAITMLVAIACLAIFASLHGADAAAAERSLKVSVSLSPELAKQAAPEDVLFIFARAVQGPRMPLAIVRKQVKDMPLTVVLDDSQAMTPHMKMSTVPEFIVVARISKSGLAEASNGDLEGMSQPVKPGIKAISINISKVLTGQPAPPKLKHP